MGTICFDDVAIKKLPPVPPALITVELENPWFRDQIFSTNPLQTINGTVTVHGMAPKVETTLTKLAASAPLFNAEVILVAGQGRFSFPAERLPAGEYVLTLKTTVDGKTAEVRRTIRKLAPTINEVTFRPNRVMYFNNRPFFPVLFWQLFPEPSDAILYFAARNGITCFIGQAKTGAQAKMLLDRADKYGLKVIIPTGIAPNTTKNSLALWEHSISSLLRPEVMAHPALLGYFLVDEPHWNGKPVKCLTASYEIIKALDPYHPIWINEAPRGSVEIHREYSQAADIYGIDIYPVPYPNSHSGMADKGLTSVGKYARQTAEICAGHKPAWMALQGFAWGNFQKGKPVVYPTWQELRFMTYDALLSGADAVAYWGLQYIEDPAFYDCLYQMTRELHTLSGLFADAPILTDAVHTDNPRIQCRAYRHGNHLYILAVNHSDSTENVIFTGNLQAAQLAVFTEQRNIEVGNHQFSDIFKPFDVHIYGESALPAPIYHLYPEDKSMEKAGNPALQYIETRKKQRPYTGHANWIWEKNSAQKPYSQVCLARSIELNRPILSAQLQITADDDYRVFINGQFLGSDCQGEKGSWSTMETYNCLSLLKNGLNAITVAGADAGSLPCGVLLDLEIVFTDGTRMQCISDETWHAVTGSVSDWHNPAVFNTWPQAVKIASYGQGAWRNGVTVTNP